jgi:hypothetical protein
MSKFRHIPLRFQNVLAQNFGTEQKSVGGIKLKISEKCHN